MDKEEEGLNGDQQEDECERVIVLTIVNGKVFQIHSMKLIFRSVHVTL